MLINVEERRGPAGLCISDVSMCVFWLIGLVWQEVRGEGEGGG